MIKVNIDGTQVITECEGRADDILAELTAIVRGTVQILLKNDAPIAPVSLMGRVLNDVIHEEIGRASLEGITSEDGKAD
jgi:hypothetical protein